MKHPSAAGAPRTQNLREALQQGVTALGLDLQGSQIDALLAYLALIQKWNQVYNLTAVREPQDMLSQHILDSLAVLPPLLRQAPKAKRLLDVGSGAGLPGVVLALASPELQVTCLDAVAKKAAFIAQVAGSLAMPNLLSMHGRVETLKPETGQAWDLICSRAYASLADFVAGSKNALAPGGLWVAMKGKPPQDEIEALPAGVEMFHVEPIQVPQLDAQRCLVWMRRR